MFTTPYVFSAEDAIAMAAASAHVIVCHLGLTTGGSIGAETGRSLDGCVSFVNEWAAAARTIREDVLVLVHGRPIAEPQDARYVLSRTKGTHGFYGASSLGRLPPSGPSPSGPESSLN
jgi:predicted TIM-barrel enzyme